MDRINDDPAWAQRAYGAIDSRSDQSYRRGYHEGHEVGHRNALELVFGVDECFRCDRTLGWVICPPDCCSRSDHQGRPGHEDRSKGCACAYDHSEMWVPSLGDRVRSVESGHDATVTKISREGPRIWLTLDFGTHLAAAGPADVYLLEPPADA